MIDDENPEWTARDFRHAIPGSQFVRLRRGEFRSGDDVAALRRLSKLTRAQFAAALCIDLGTLRAWERAPEAPTGPALVVLRIAARHPRILRECLATASAP